MSSFISQGDDGDWYIIPSDKDVAWQAWDEVYYGNPADKPKFAEKIPAELITEMAESLRPREEYFLHLGCDYICYAVPESKRDHWNEFLGETKQYFDSNGCRWIQPEIPSYAIKVNVEDFRFFLE